MYVCVKGKKNEEDTAATESVTQAQWSDKVLASLFVSLLTTPLPIIKSAKIYLKKSFEISNNDPIS